MRSNKPKFYLISALVFAVIFIFNLTACETVAPAAWVRLEAGDGKVYYSTDMYGYNSAHISYYENEEDTRAVIEISFSPRILGPDEVDGVKTTLVDVARFYAMYITVYKNNDTYSPDKAFYLNGAETPLEPTRSDDTYSSFVTFEFENFGLVRGNPGGRINGVVNVIEYK